MRETGPVGYRLSKASDARYTGFARKYLGVVMNIHRGLSYGRSSTRLLDGTRITIAWNNNARYIYINTEEVSSQDDEFDTPIFMESGFIAGTRGVNFDADLYYTSELKSDLSVVGGSWLDWLYVNTLASVSRVYTEGMESLGIPDVEKLNDFAGLYNYSTQSGKGLLMLQAQAGTNNEAELGDYNGPTIP